ncbi:MAG: vWA domain-containing protein, partial [Candidatus Binatia bacterium]|nr:vWA domain-containing protein [Candidatus Binatia bacterium]
SVQGTKPVATTFLNFLSWMVPGDYTKINVSALAQAAPERPIDLMLVLDRSGSMGCATCTDGTGTLKITALKNAVSQFLGLSNTFSSDDRIGMVSFSSRGCGDPATGRDSNSTAATCAPDAALDFSTTSYITTLQNRVNALVADGGTNTMEALRVARGPLALAFTDPTRATTRKAVLLVTDGQPTFMRRDSDSQCESNPIGGALPRNGPGNASGGPFTNGCIQGVPTATTSTSGFMYRHQLNPIPSNSCYYLRIPGGWTSTNCPQNTVADNTTQASGSPITDPALYRNTIGCTRSMVGCVTNGAMYEANQIRNCGFSNSACASGGDHDVVIFTIAIGKVDLTNPQNSMDKNAKCLLARISNATDVMITATGVVETISSVCTGQITTADGDTHADLNQGWPCGTGPCIDTTQEKGRVYIIDSKLNVQAQLQTVFDEIAKLLKLRLVI